jgi:hypothetical protein
MCGPTAQISGTHSLVPLNLLIKHKLKDEIRISKQQLQAIKH